MKKQIEITVIVNNWRYNAMIYGFVTGIEAEISRYNYKNTITATAEQWLKIAEYIINLNISYRIDTDDLNAFQKNIIIDTKLVEFQEPVRVVNGKLQQNGKKIIIEQGNLRHINALKQIEKYNDGVDVDVDYEITIEAEASFFCSCGRKIRETLEVDDEDEEYFNEVVTKCYSCGQKYQIYIDESDGILRAVFI